MSQQKFSAFDVHRHQEDISSKIVVGLERVSELFRVMLWEKAKPLKLSPLQIQLLIYISFHSPQKNKVTQLAHAFHLSKPTLSDALKVLRGKGYIQKNIEASDKRSHYLSLTQEGQKLLEDIAFFANPLVDLIRDWEKGEQEAFYHSLLKLISTCHVQGLIDSQSMCYSCRYFEKKNSKPFCSFLKKSLETHQLRVDCPDYLPTDGE